MRRDHPHSEGLSSTIIQNFSIGRGRDAQQNNRRDFSISVSAVATDYCTPAESPTNCAEIFVDHFPILSEPSITSRGVRSAVGAADTLATFNSDVKPPVLSYLALACKFSEVIEGPDDDCRSIPKEEESSWYYSSAPLLKMPTTVLSSASQSMTAGGSQNIIRATSEVLLSHISNQGEGDPEKVLTASTVSIDNRGMNQARITPISSGSKSAAERWKGRWLDIARQQSLLQKKRLEHNLEISLADYPAAISRLQQPWHCGLSQSQGSEQGQMRQGQMRQGHMKGQRMEEEAAPVPYSYLYTRQTVSEGQLVGNTSSRTSPLQRKNSERRIVSEKASTEYSALQWWTAVLTGDHFLLLKMLVEEKFKPDLCFCYTTYILDCQLAVKNNESSIIDASRIALRCLSALHPVCGSSRGHKAMSYQYSCEDDGYTAIHMCAKLRHPVCLDHLLRSITASGADARDRTHKRSPLHLACEAVSLECVKILLLHGADPECRDKLGDTALHKACASCLSPSPSAQVTLVSFLCERSKSNNAANGGSLKVNTKNKKRETALMFARTRELAVILIGAGADPSFISSEGLDAASMASRRGDAKVLEAILGCNSFRQLAITPTSNSSTLSSRKSVCTINAGLFTSPLHEASKANSISCVKILLSARYFNISDLDRLDSPGDCTSLMLACAAGHVRVVQELLSKGADLGVEDRRGVTALVIAARSGHTLCVRAIITARPGSPFKTNSVGENVLEMLARILRQDLSHQDHSTWSNHTEHSSVDLTERCFPCVTELLMRGAPVTDRFIRRFSSSNRLEMLKSMKLSRHNFNVPSSFLLDSAHKQSRIATMTFDVDIWDSIWRVPRPGMDLCDVSFLLADGEKCQAHSFIVCSGSAVLKAMLLSEMSTSCFDDETGVVTTLISFPYHSKDTFSLLLEWMYNVSDVTDIFDLALSNHQAALLDLLYLANEFLVTPLQRLCEHRIGRHLGYFDKETLLSLGISLHLQLLLTYYYRSYPSVTDLSSQFPNTSAQLGIDQCSYSTLSAQVDRHPRCSQLADFSIKCLLVDSDLEWCRRLAAVPSEDTTMVDRSSSLRSRCEGREVRVRTFESFDEYGPVSWWFHTMIVLACDKLGKDDQCLGSLDTVLSVAQSDLTRWCKDIISTADSKEQEKIMKSEKSFDFTYTASPAKCVSDVRVSSLSALDPDSRLRCMLTDLRRRTLTINILSGPSACQSSSQLSHHTPTVKYSYDSCRRSILECEPFLALGAKNLSSTAHLGSDSSIIMTPDVEERLITRLDEITPPCVLLQQQRSALLCKPESSLFDTIIVLVSPTASPTSDGINRRNAAESGESDGSEELWCTRNNGRYLHYSSNRDNFQEEEGEHLDILPVHKALLTVGSGKLVAMMHFASAQGTVPCSYECSEKRDVTILRINLDGQEDAVRDFKDLIWFMYTGVLRGFASTTQAEGDIESTDVGERYQERNDARHLRLLWLADEYLMSDLTRLLEYRMMEDLSPDNASSFFIAAQALGLQTLCLAAGICVLYSIGATIDKKNEKFTTIRPISSANGPDTAFQVVPDVEVSIEGDDTLQDEAADESSTILVLLEILRSLTVSIS